MSVCAVLLIGSCKSSGAPPDAKSQSGSAAPITGKQWRLSKDTIAADSRQDYAVGAEALRTLDAFGTMEVSKLFYHGVLLMLSKGTLVAQEGPGGKDATEVRVLDGPQSGKTLWLYPESAEKLGFATPAPTP